MNLPPPNSRVAFVGPTRSGKTVLARSWLKYYDHVAVLDPKGQFSWKDGRPRYQRIATTWDRFRKLMELSAKDGFPVIYRPPSEDLLPQNADRLDRFYWYCLQRGNTTTYIDELYFLASGSDFATRAPWFFRAVTTGASHGVGVWSAFQRPSWVPLIALTETELRAIFYLRVAGDRERIGQSFGEIPWDALRVQKHSFVLSSDEWTSTIMRLKLTQGGSFVNSTGAPDLSRSSGAAS